MGEARRKRETHEAILKRFPYCIYCGGQQPATSIEHMPPIMMFKGKQRPDGLVFPACDECNQGTSHSDLVASMLGRVYPDAGDPIEKADIQKTISAVANNVPGVLNEMHLDDAEQELTRRRLGIGIGGGFLRLNGPLLTRHMTVFAAKLGLALYFDATGKALPVTGRIVPFWFSNVQSLEGKIPAEFLNTLPALKTLQQGRKSVGDQFQYSQFVAPDGLWAGFFATFRFSFAAASAVSVDGSHFVPDQGDRWPHLSPGRLL